MSIFGHNFETNHIYLLDDGKQYNKNQIVKYAIERFLTRGEEINTLIFLTKSQLQQLESYVQKCVPKGRTYTFNKPMIITYPPDRHSLTLQKLTAVVTVAKRDNNEERLYQAYTVKEGANYGVNPIINFKYGLIGQVIKKYAIFHYQSVDYSRAPEHQAFSLTQYRDLNSNANENEAWIKPLFDHI